jgi:hypothetical protein
LDFLEVANQNLNPLLPPRLHYEEDLILVVSVSQFVVSDLTCFTVENITSQIYVLKYRAKLDGPVS